MTLDIIKFVDFRVVMASLTGSIVYILTQHRFDRNKKPFIFMVSFVMGIIGADATLRLVNELVPYDFSGERAVGAFLCSALVVTVAIKIISYVERKIK